MEELQIFILKLWKLSCAPGQGNAERASVAQQRPLPRRWVSARIAKTAGSGNWQAAVKGYQEEEATVPL